MTEETTHFGRQQVPITQKAARVAEVFHSVANRYDVMNDLMSLGSHRLMKQLAIQMTAARAGDKIMDLAGGTGDLTEKLSQIVGASGQVTLCDINYSMLSNGRDRQLDSGISCNLD
jgi:demethylmenaquinone methyltransferase/2-methoxy-6-polyprenyl-1,4-benzoquinol methylase